MIPKKFHYVWIGPYKDKRTYVDTWKSSMPQYEVIYWHNPVQYIDLAVKMFGGVDKLSSKSFTYISDLIRLLILRDHGGVYMDHDMYVVKNFESLLDTDVVLTYQYTSIGPEFTKGKTLKELLDSEYGKHQTTSATVNNSFIACIPNHSFIQLVIEDTINNHFANPSEQYAMSDWGVGPEVFTKIAKQYNFKVDICETETIEGIKILSRKYLHPTHCLVRYLGEEKYKQEIKDAFENKDTYAIHFHLNEGAKVFSQGSSISFSDWYLKSNSFSPSR